MQKSYGQKLEARCWWSNRTLIHPRPFPACLTWLQWRPGGGSAATAAGAKLDPLSAAARQPVSSVLLVVPAVLRPDPTSAGFRASGLQLLSSSVSQSLQPGRPSAPDAILHLHNRAKGSLSFSSFYPILIVAPFRITECITWSESLRRFSSPLFSSI